MAKKKILHIQVFPKLSGVQKISLEILKALPNEEFEKHILFCRNSDCGDQSECVRAFENAGVKVMFSKHLKREIGFQDIPAYFEIYRLCQREGYDIVHTNSTKPGIVGRLAAYCARVPLVVHTVHGLAFHSLIKFPYWHFYYSCEMFASLFCHKIAIVNSFYTKYFKWCKNKVMTIYNGSDFSKYPSLPLHRSNDENVTILFVGRLDIPKNPLGFLEAAKRIHEIYPNVKFKLVGDGEFMEDCKRFISSNDLKSAVSLEGWQTDVYKYYAESDIFAVPSLYEAFGLMFLECGFYELPVCSTTVEGVPEVISNGETGLLCEPNNIDKFTNNIILLIKNPALRKSMGKAAHKRVIELFNSQNMIDSYVKLYSEFSSRE